MGVFCISSFFVYLVIFSFAQQVIARRSGVPNFRSVEPPVHFILLALGGTLIPLSVFTMPRRFDFSTPAVRLVGAVVAILGLILSIWGQREIGRFWVGAVGLHKGHRLVMTGPYRHVRNPMYSGILLSGIGLGMLSLNLLFALGSLLFASSYASRVWAEEALLRKKFKGKYERYVAETGRFVPRIRKQS